MIKSIVASAKVNIAVFIHLQIVRTRDFRNEKNITKRKKNVFLIEQLS